ncbi:MAG: hypothetical protein JWN46_950, partial [Acidimicrobiales bacterium]|nr:hypothetical protein [Acidimicrobiales bacterium]
MTVLRVDGRTVEVPAHADAWPLAEVLRASGTAAVKMPCAEGVCGGCTVQLDGVPVPSCLVPAARADGAEIRTAESITADGLGERLARALAARGALQCGYCIAGLVASAACLLDHACPSANGHGPGNGSGPAEPSGAPDQAVRAALAGHLCRCTGYAGLVDAVTTALAEVAGDSDSDGTGDAAA